MPVLESTRLIKETDNRGTRANFGSGRSVFGVLGLYGIAAIVGYWPILNAYFVADDATLLAGVRNSGPFANWSTLGAHFFRPATSVLFWVEWKLFGDHPVFYHCVSLALLVLTAMLIRSLAINLIEAKHASLVGTIAGLLFVLFPSHPEAVAWIADSSDLLGTAFLMGSMLAYLRYSRSETRRVAIFWASAAFISYAVGACCKEQIAFSIVFAVPAICIATLRPLKKSVVETCAAIALFLIYFYIRRKIIGVTVGYGGHPMVATTNTFSFNIPFHFANTFFPFINPLQFGDDAAPIVAIPVVLVLVYIWHRVSVKKPGANEILFRGTLHVLLWYIYLSYAYWPRRRAFIGDPWIFVIAVALEVDLFCYWSSFKRWRGFSMGRRPIFRGRAIQDLARWKYWGTVLTAILLFETYLLFESWPVIPTWFFPDAFWTSTKLGYLPLAVRLLPGYALLCGIGVLIVRTRHISRPWNWSRNWLGQLTRNERIALSFSFAGMATWLPSFALFVSKFIGFRTDYTATAFAAIAIASWLTTLRSRSGLAFATGLLMVASVPVLWKNADSWRRSAAGTLAVVSQVNRILSSLKHPPGHILFVTRTFSQHNGVQQDGYALQSFMDIGCHTSAPVRVAADLAEASEGCIGWRQVFPGLYEVWAKSDSAILTPIKRDDGDYGPELYSTWIERPGHIFIQLNSGFQRGRDLLLVEVCGQVTQINN